MNRTKLSALVVVLALLALAPAAGSAPTGPVPVVPELVSYQGHVLFEGKPFNGKGYFKFAIVDALDTVHWANDDLRISGEPEKWVPLDVTNGLFNVLLGDITLGGMSKALTATVFEGADRYLRVWFSTDSTIPFTQLKEDRRIAAAPYALVAQEAVHALDADTLQGSDAGDFQRHYANVVIVAKSGGDFATITAALISITTASDTNRYLVWVAPGIYHEQVTMKQYVDIAGAGQLLTRITGAGSGTLNSGTLLGANDAELRDLTVENTGDADFAVAIFNGADSPRLARVTAIAAGGGRSYGVRNYNGSSPVMTDVTASASGKSGAIGVANVTSCAPVMTRVTAEANGDADSDNYGVYNEASWPQMTDVRATATGDVDSVNYGVMNNYADALMTNVTAEATGGSSCFAVYNSHSSPEMHGVTATASAGNNHNYGIWNGDSSPIMTAVVAWASGGSVSYGVYNSTSYPVMTGVTATADAANTNYGVYNLSSSPTMNDVVATGSGGNYNIGVRNESSSPTMTGVTALGYGTATSLKNYGVANEASQPTISNSTLRAAGAGDGIGLGNSGNTSSYVVRVSNCQVMGYTNSILNATAFTTLVGASLLDGAVDDSAGTVTCAGVYNESYAFYASTCP